MLTGRLSHLSWKPVDRTPPQGPSRACATAVAVVVLVLCGACGEERAQAPPRNPFPPPAVPGQDTLRDRFSLLTGAACSRSYAELAPLQARLRQLRRDVRRSSRARKPQARSQARQVIERMQSRSRRFLGNLNTIPLPSSPRRRHEASRLLESTEELVLLQLESLDIVSGLLGEPTRVARAERARLPRLRRRIRAGRREQQRLVRRLDIPECVSA